ncbi:DUF1405 domain-containing protein [Pelotomaculum propionicicum]|uniref:DUF1405 domain-containing protein n=1 Tax=Pelotomaculum propionicicum TaxID=258475 RepID=UPI003B7F3383
MSLILKLWRDFWRDPWQPRFTIPLMVINVLGSLYGYYWYHEQLASIPFHLWLFVSDSPLSSTLFALALLMRGNGQLGRLFQVVAFTAVIKYGIWAMVIITHFCALYGNLGYTEIMLWVSHLGMAAEGIIFLKALQFERAIVYISGMWMLLNDIMDYYAGLHPYLFADGQELAALVTAFALTFLITAGLVLLQRVMPLRQVIK